MDLICPKCNAKLDADPALAGRLAECPECRASILIPRGPAPSTPSDHSDLHRLESVLRSILVEAKATSRSAREIRSGVLFLCLCVLVAFLLSVAAGVMSR